MIEFIGWLVGMYLVVGVLLTIFIFEAPHWEVDVMMGDEPIPTNYHWLSQLLNILLWPYVAWKNWEEDE